MLAAKTVAAVDASAMAVLLVNIGSADDLRFVFDTFTADPAVLAELATVARSRNVVPSGDVATSTVDLLGHADPKVRAAAARLAGAWRVNPWVAFGATLGMILGAAYMLWLYRRVIFGRITRDDLRALLDLSPREFAVFAPLVLLTLWMGAHPQSFLSFFEASVANLVARHEAALGAARLAGIQ